MSPAADESRSEDELRRDAEAALAARRDLGADYDEQIAAGLAERVSDIVEKQSSEAEEPEAADKEIREQRFWLALASIGGGIPISGIGATQVDPGLLGVGLGWAGIVAINVVFGLGSRRRRRRGD